MLDNTNESPNQQSPTFWSILIPGFYRFWSPVSDIKGRSRLNLLLVNFFCCNKKIKLIIFIEYQFDFIIRGTNQQLSNILFPPEKTLTLFIGCTVSTNVLTVSCLMKERLSYKMWAFLRHESRFWLKKRPSLASSTVSTINSKDKLCRVYHPVYAHQTNNVHHYEKQFKLGYQQVFLHWAPGKAKTAKDAVRLDFFLKTWIMFMRINQQWFNPCSLSKQLSFLTWYLNKIVAWHRSSDRPKQCKNCFWLCFSALFISFFRHNHSVGFLVRLNIDSCLLTVSS